MVLWRNLPTSRKNVRMDGIRHIRFSMDNLLKYVGLPASIMAAVGLTMERISGLDLLPRLIATAILAFLVQHCLAKVLARHLASYVVAHRCGFVRKQGISKATCRIQVGGAILTILLSGIIASGLGWLQTEYLVISAAQSTRDGSQILTLTASWVNAERIELPLPAPPTNCELISRNANARQLDWDGPVRALALVNFVGQQTAEVKCDAKKPIDVGRIKVSGPADGPYHESEMRTARILIAITGVLLWTYGILHLYRLLREASP